MVEKRSWIERIFGKSLPQAPSSSTQLQMMGGFVPSFSSFGNNPYSSDVVRSSVHAIASAAAKMKPRHIRRTVEGVHAAESQVERLLQLRPNPYMSGYDFIYKVVTQLYMRGNAFVFTSTEGAYITGFYPVPASQVEFLEVPGGPLYVRFKFLGGKSVTLPYSEIIHLRRFFFENELFGEANDALMPTLELINTTNQGIINAVKSSAHLRGLLKFTQTMLKPEDIRKERDRFVSEYMTINNDGGIAAIDAKADYQPLNSDPKLINGEQMALIEEKVHKYFGLNKAIIAADYTESQWAAFYESVIEPLAVQMSLEFTAKVFTEREVGHGNEIIFEANRLQHASAKTKIELVKHLMDRGLLSINEAREIFNLAPLPDGERRILSLNYVNAAKADKYQLGEGGVEDGDEEGDAASGAANP